MVNRLFPFNFLIKFERLKTLNKKLEIFMHQEK